MCLCVCVPVCVCPPEVDGERLVKFDLATRCADHADRGISAVVIAFVSVGFPILTSSFLFYINERSRSVHVGLGTAGSPPSPTP